MKKTCFEEQSATALRQVDAEASVPEVTRTLGISEATSYVWRKRYGQMAVAEIRRLRQLEVAITICLTRIDAGITAGRRSRATDKFEGMNNGRRIERRILLKAEDCSLESHEKGDRPGFLASIIHDCSLRNAAATRDKRDSRDVLALFLPVALFSPVSPESGIGDCSRSAHE